MEKNIDDRLIDIEFNILVGLCYFSDSSSKEFDDGSCVHREDFIHSVCQVPEEWSTNGWKGNALHRHN